METGKGVLDAGAAVAGVASGLVWVHHLHRVVEDKVVEAALQQVGPALVLVLVLVVPSINKNMLPITNSENLLTLNIRNNKNKYFLRVKNVLNALFMSLTPLKNKKIKSIDVRIEVLFAYYLHI